MKTKLTALLVAGLTAACVAFCGAQAEVKEQRENHMRVEILEGGSAAAPDAKTMAVSLFGGLPDPVNVSVTVREKPLREALKTLFDSAKRQHVVDKDVPDPRVSIELHGVDLQTALDALTQSAEVGYRLEMDGTKHTYRITRDRSRSHRLSVYGPVMAAKALEGWRSGTLGPSDLPLVYSTRLSEERSVFTCPHCKGQATTVKQRSQVRCPKCDRVFQPDWQFCPVDGAKRPAAAGAWKHCPFCGKSVG